MNSPDYPLAENERTVEVAGDNQLKVFARELLPNLSSRILTIGWAHLESARARIRALLMRVPDKSDRPRNRQDMAAQAVRSPAEMLSASGQSF